uniref:Uncharacterized protein n=1 Tax=Anguilla anguilla TaxID=7936 RepID=A0A0E9VM38_ANGAN
MVYNVILAKSDLHELLNAYLGIYTVLHGSDTFTRYTAKDLN